MAPKLRRLVPSTSLLTRSTLLFLPMDLVDALVAAAYPETAGVPPARFRMRVGMGNRLVFNQVAFRYWSVPFWTHALHSNWVGLESAILDLGSGCGRYAIGLRGVGWQGARYTGPYTGIDVDREMVRWCQATYPDNFRFLHHDVYNRVYNPDGRRGSAELPIESSSQDFFLGMSLLTHLLEDELSGYLLEAHRVMRPGGRMVMSVFCVENMESRLGARWSFEHRVGAAYVENPRYPEAAVAYERAFLLSAAERAGFSDVSLRGAPQSMLTAAK